MSAIFKEFGLERMAFSEGALRLGVLYDQLGRYHHEDLREATVSRFMQRYEVDQKPGGARRHGPRSPAGQMVPSSRGGASGCAVPGLGGAPARGRHIGGPFELPQAQRLHPRQCRHAGVFAARPGAPVALVLAHRGKLERAQPLRGEAPEWTLIFCLRTAVCCIARAMTSPCRRSPPDSPATVSRSRWAPADWMPCRSRPPLGTRRSNGPGLAANCGSIDCLMLPHEAWL
jgi:hypothetical protein